MLTVVQPRCSLFPHQLAPRSEATISLSQEPAAHCPTRCLETSLWQLTRPQTSLLLPTLAISQFPQAPQRLQRSLLLVSMVSTEPSLCKPRLLLSVLRLNVARGPLARPVSTYPAMGLLPRRSQ